MPRTNWTARATTALREIRDTTGWQSDALAADAAIASLIQDGCDPGKAEASVRAALPAFQLA